MPKRFIDSAIWDDAEFVSASPRLKLLAIFMISKCDAVGVFNMAPAIISAYLGEKFVEKDVLSCPVNVEKIGDTKYWMRKFCTHQYGRLDDTCRPHQSYFKLLKAHGILECEPMANDTLCIPYQKGMHTHKEKEIDKDKEKEKEKEQEKPPSKPNPWFDAVREVFGLIGKTQAPRVQKVSGSMREQTPAEVEPIAEIRRRMANYTSHMKDCACTPEALAKHWALCAEWNPKVYRKMTEEERAAARAIEIAEMEAKGKKHVP